MAVSNKYPYEVTAADRAEFEAALRKWQTELNLNDWRVVFLKTPAGAGNAADVSISYKDKFVKVRLAARMHAPYEPGEIDAFALHEMWHVRLAELVHAVENELGDSAIEAAEHAIVVLMTRKMIGEHVANS